MNRKRIARCLVLVGLLGAALPILRLASSPRSPINRANYDRIAVGMSRQEVESILGGRGRDETDGEFIAVHTYSLGPRYDSESWLSEDGYIQVLLDEDDRVCKKGFTKTWPNRRPTWYERMRAQSGIPQYTP